MTDQPPKLRAVPLEEATPQEKQQLVEMMTDMAAIAQVQDSGHRCWFLIPNDVEFQRMKKFNEQGCPQCKGRIFIEVFHGNIGDSLFAVCFNKKCDFRECISDLDDV